MVDNMSNMTKFHWAGLASAGMLLLYLTSSSDENYPINSFE